MFSLLRNEGLVLALTGFHWVINVGLQNLSKWCWVTNQRYLHRIPNLVSHFALMGLHFKPEARRLLYSWLGTNLPPGQFRMSVDPWHGEVS